MNHQRAKSAPLREARIRAARWLQASRRAVRVRPPGSFKDWTEAHAGEVDLRRWWLDRLAGVEVPPLFTWDELSTWHWGLSNEDEPDTPNTN
jgi:hypothetical protein